MARPKRSNPGARLTAVVDASLAAELDRLAVQATRESGKPVLASELHRRLLRPAMIAGKSCKGCRLGTCDGEHARKVAPTIGELVRVADAAGLDVVVEAKPIAPPDPPAAVTTIEIVKTVLVDDHGQADLFGSKNTTVVEPAPIPAPDKPKRGRPPGVKNGEGKRKPREITPESPEHARLVRFYEERFEEVRKEKPAWVSRDFAAFKALREKVGFDRACELIRNAFADGFWSKRVTIQKIAADPSMFAGNGNTQGERPSTMQREELAPGWS